MVFAVRYLALYINAVQHKVLSEHVFNIRIDLSDCIHVTHLSGFLLLKLLSAVG